MKRLISHVPKWEPAELPIDAAGNTRPGYICTHMMENGNGQCVGNIFNLDQAIGDHYCAVDGPVYEEATRPPVDSTASSFWRDLLRTLAGEWEAANAALANVTNERDSVTRQLTETVNNWRQVRQELANVTSALDDLKQANDALHDARDNTARLLEEARAAAEQVRDLHECEHYERFDMDYCVECSDVESGVFVGWPCGTIRCLDDARQHATAEGASTAEVA